MKIHSSGKWVILGAFVVVTLLFRAGAQETPAGAAAAVVVVSKPASSDGIADILKMLDAKVSKEVIKAYIENSPAACNLTAGDIIALKEHGASDDITTALLKRGPEIKAQAAQAAVASAVAQGSSAVATVAGAGVPRGFDPESYDYFSYYYLYPRTLASVNERLGYYAAPYPYGAYYPALPGGPYFARPFGLGRGPFQPLRDGRFR